ncbi:RNA polymerase sigma factor [Streptomyces sp. TLI_171]|uniref:RNA polymerase sigma factor n=1 Tax=Streptomyces sp. TLI_171 TaxID=1938859 RepID=UPI000C1979EF|nr:RNA polymerase sigma factor [Streptomyces sp. TLI_171]RKE22835.1 RNA polymerase sigma-70 factor (ECF subfamily) [Streptomyces sp. TLI_171]
MSETEPIPAPWERAAPLVTAARGGDALALDELITLLLPYVTRLCRPIALADAPDAAQEALIAVLRGLPGLTDPRALYGWVRTVTVREAVRTARRTRRHLPLDAAVDRADGADPALSAALRDCLHRLTPEHRAVLVLRELEGLDERSCAELLGLSRGTVKSRLHRAKHNFRLAWTS